METLAAPLITQASRVELRPDGKSTTVLIDGEDVSNLVSRLTYDHQAGELPKVFLELSPLAQPADFSSDAIVHTVQYREEDSAEATLRFLEPLDGGEFEKDVLARLELGGPSSFGEAALEVLRGYARGDS